MTDTNPTPMLETAILGGGEIAIFHFIGFDDIDHHGNLADNNQHKQHRYTQHCPVAVAIEFIAHHNKSETAGFRSIAILRRRPRGRFCTRKPRAV